MIVLNETYDIDPRFKMIKASYGPSYSDEQIKDTLKRFGLVEGKDYEELTDDEVVGRSVGYLAENKVIVWFQGGSEIGPRALGNRSILFNSTDFMANLTANKVKARQPWRPSAMSIAEDAVPTYLYNAGPSPFMVIGFKVN